MTKLAGLAWLILRNVRRNRRRTILTVLSVAVALFIVIFLRTLLTVWEEATESPSGARRLIVQHAVSLANPLPETFVDRVRRVPGVLEVCGGNWFGGVLDRDRWEDFFANFGLDHETFFQVNPEILPESEEQRRAWLEDKAGALVGVALAERHGWKVGDEVTLLGTIYACDLTLTVRALYRPAPGETADENQMFFHRDYMEEALGRPGRVNHVAVRLADGADPAAVIDAIDREFENSEAPTRSATEKAFLLQFQEMQGNMKGLLSAIGAAVVLSVLLATANSMAMAVRERMREVAVLKAIGFTPEHVVAIVASEALLTALAGGALALSAAVLLFDVAGLSPNQAYFPSFHPTPGTLLLCAGLAALIGIASALGPAVRVARLAPAEGLRRIE